MKCVEFILGDAEAEKVNFLLLSKKWQHNDAPERLLRSLELAKETLSQALTIPDNVKTIITLAKVEYLQGVYSSSKRGSRPSSNRYQ